MAKKAKAENGPIPGNSGFDPAVVNSVVDRIEHLEEEKKAIANDIKEIKETAEGAHGIPKRALNQVLRDRKVREKLGKDEFEAFQDQIDRLKHCLGELADLPLGQSALSKVKPNVEAAA